MKRSKLLAAAAVIALASSGSAFAFHEGGVAYCDGCHTMHNSSGNKAMAKNGKAQFTGNTYLLQGSDQSSTCLNCHSSSSAGGYHIATNPVPAAGTPPVNYTPGGDFAWVKKSFSGTATYGATVTSPGDRHGHNVNAADYGYTADATLTAAPGGTYPAANLHCTSCHDPHGKYRQMDTNGTIATTGAPTKGSGSYGDTPNVNASGTTTESVGVYRLLAGAGYLPDSVAGNPALAFANNSPVAVAPSTYNRKETTTDTRVAYGTGMSEWCANCHTSIHNSSVDTGALIHPAASDATLTSDIVNNYNSYVASGNLTGTQATAYTSMVPFEEGTKAITALAAHAVNDGSQTGGATSTSNVMCLSCHRAHASGWDSMSRWNNKGEFLTIAGNYPGSDAPTVEGQGAQYSGGKTMAEVQATFYDRPATTYATYQRSLCNKCHAKD